VGRFFIGSARLDLQKQKFILSCMKRFTLTLTALLILLMTKNILAQTPQDFAAAWDKQRITTIAPSAVRHTDLEKYLEQLKAAGVAVTEAGRSAADREIYQLEWGKGKTRVLMWSQMHGDEPTATSTLVDLFYFLQKNPDVPWVKRLSETFTLRAVPMLNPDGAELFQRRNAQFIDINRDARDLATPEGRLLKKLRDDWQPEIGFNLHNQNPLTSVGRTRKQATISLLAVSGDPEGKSSPAHLRSKRLCAVMIEALQPFIKGHIGRYDDDYNPRAFGDRMSEWGTATILVETGALHGKDEMYLIKLNFIAYLAALQALVDGSEAKTDAAVYDKTPFNETGYLYSYIFRDANIVNRFQTDKARVKPFTADVAINSERRRAGADPALFVQEIGDLDMIAGVEEFNAKDYYLVPAAGVLRMGAEARLLFYKKSSTKNIDWAAPNLETAHPPDAVFNQGKWEKGGHIFKPILNMRQ
jgi:hypothetical protein